MYYLKNRDSNTIPIMDDRIVMCINTSIALEKIISLLCFIERIAMIKNGLSLTSVTSIIATSYKVKKILVGYLEHYYLKNYTSALITK